MDLTDQVDGAGDQRRVRGGGVRVIGHVDTVEGRMASPPVVVAVVLRAYTGGVRRDLEGAGRLRSAGEAAELVVGGQDDALIRGGAQQVREACRGSVQLELHSEVVDLRDAPGR